MASKELSARELECVLLYATKCVTDIARQLNLSVKTVSTHLTRAQEKLKLRDRRELSHVAQTFAERESGLFEVPAAEKAGAGGGVVPTLQG